MQHSWDYMKLLYKRHHNNHLCILYFGDFQYISCKHGNAYLGHYQSSLLLYALVRTANKRWSIKNVIQLIFPAAAADNHAKEVVERLPDRVTLQVMFVRSVRYGNMEFVSSKYAIKVAKIQWKFNPDCRYLSNSVRYLENVWGFTVALCQTNFPPGIWLGAFSSGENVQSQTPLKEGKCLPALRK